MRDGWLGSGVVRDGWPGSDVVRGCGCWVRCGDRAEQDAGAAQGALADFLPREKALDKLCKSILDWKQEITQEVARDRRRRRGRDAPTASGE